MEEKELNLPKIDLIFLFRIWLRYARRFWALALVLAILCAGVLGYSGYKAYRPTYEASVSFTVKVANPLYGNVTSYNIATAKQLNATFPYILRSAILRQRVSELLEGLDDDLDLSGVEDEELVDPVDLAAEYNLDDPVRMYLKEIGQIRLLSADVEALRMFSFLVNALLRHKEVAVVSKDYTSKAALDCSLGG